MTKSATTAFTRLFGRGPEVTTRAPGRVNLIGEHVDYNDGLVLPLAIDRCAHVAAARRDDRTLRIHSQHFDETVQVGFERPPTDHHHWSDYVAGVAWSLQRAGKQVAGADLLISSGIPLGSGLSSSAAIEVATALALLALSGERMPAADIALVCQRAENRYVDAQTGIMDQMAVCLGREGHALLVDCRSLDVEPVAIDEKRVRVVVANTMVRHALAESVYNERREQCQRAVELLKAARPATTSLRDVGSAELDSLAADWPADIQRRARHVTTEIERVRLMVEALRQADYQTAGELMAQSHDSLRDDFEVSCPELDRMVELAQTLPGVHGARMTGGGFGGCTVNLVQADLADDAAELLRRRYLDRTGIGAEVFVALPSNGAAVVSFAAG